MNKFLALLLTVSFSFAQFRDIPEVVTKVATSTANWLKLETSARAIGMGGSHVASGRGISGIPYNPCLLYTSPSPRDYAASRMPSSA